MHFASVARGLGVVALALAPLGAAPVAPPPLLPVELFFSRPAIANLTFSPDGRRLACLMTYERRANLAVIDLEKMTKVRLTSFKDRDVATLLWANDDRIVFTADPGGHENPFVYAINRDGKDAVTLREGGEEGGVNARFRRLLARVEQDKRHILVEADIGQRGYPDVCTMDLITGNMDVVVPNPGRVRTWIVDRQKNVRVGVAQEGIAFQVLYRDAGSKSDWIVINEFKAGTPHWQPVAFDGDGRTLFVASDVGRRTVAVHRYDTLERKLGECVAADPTYDIVDIHFSPEVSSARVLYDEARKKVTGFFYFADKPAVSWIDDDAAQLQQKIDASLTGYFNRLEHASPDGTKRLIFSFCDRDPGVYYLFDSTKKKIDELAVLKSAIDPRQMAPMRPVKFAARDGLEVHAMLTLPVGRPAQKLPLVVHPHGGPYGPRDTWGFNREVQFYANRGFAVMQVNYRGSGGYGLAFLQAGFRQWGLAMQQDLSDAVQWVIAEGIADPSRVVISGASYGGYATMAGLTFTPELYCAGINYVGVTDLIFRAQQMDQSREAKLWHDVHVGSLDNERKRLADTSPVNFADRVRAPILMGYGKNDPRVDIEHCYAMERALKRAGKDYELVIEEQEGHGFRAEERAIAFFTKVDGFLQRTVLAPAGKVKIGPAQVLEMPAGPKK